jgi:hypothetical protein
VDFCPDFWGTSITLAQWGHFPFLPALAAGTASVFPHPAQVKRIVPGELEGGAGWDGGGGAGGEGGDGAGDLAASETKDVLGI